MKTRCAILSLLLLISLSWLQASYYPLGCYYVGGAEAVPITDVQGESPIAVVDGKPTKVGLSDLVFSRVPFYSDANIELLESVGYGWSSDLRSTTSLEVGAYIPIQFLVDVEFKSDRDLENCYALIVAGTKEGIALTDPDGLIMTFDSIGRVRAGKTIKKTLRGYVPNDPGGKREEAYFVVFYDGGLPLSTVFDTDVYEHFMSRKLREHASQVEAHVRAHQGQDAKQIASSTFTPYLPEALYKECGPIDTKVVLKISEQGRVTAESFSNLDHPEAEAFMRMTISDWLFLPKIENGRPVSTQTATMIQY